MLDEDVLIAEVDAAFDDEDDGTETFTTEMMFLLPPPFPPLPLPVFRLFPAVELRFAEADIMATKSREFLPDDRSLFLLLTFPDNR